MNNCFFSVTVVQDYTKYWVAQNGGALTESKFQRFVFKTFSLVELLMQTLNLSVWYKGYIIRKSSNIFHVQKVTMCASQIILLGDVSSF